MIPQKALSRLIKRRRSACLYIGLKKAASVNDHLKNVCVQVFDIMRVVPGQGHQLICNKLQASLMIWIIYTHHFSAFRLQYVLIKTIQLNL